MLFELKRVRIPDGRWKMEMTSHANGSVYVNASHSLDSLQRVIDALENEWRYALDVYDYDRHPEFIFRVDGKEYASLKEAFSAACQ